MPARLQYQHRRRGRNGEPGLDLEAKDYDPTTMRAYVFKNGEYSDSLMIPQGSVKARIIVDMPNGKSSEEAALRYVSR